MKKMSMSALLAAATVLVFPRRAEPTNNLALTAPTLDSPPRAIIGTVRADVSDPKAIADQLQKAFAEFKDANEKQLGAKVDDVLFNEKMTAINADLDKLVKAMDEQKRLLAAAQLGGGTGALTPEAAAHTDAFNSWFRKGTEPSSMRELEVKAKLTTQSDPDGGYIVPAELDKNITRVLGAMSAMRGLARVIPVGVSQYEMLISQGGAVGGWVAEKDTRPETATPTLRKIIMNMGEVYAMPGATQTMLDDGFFDVSAWLGDEVAITFDEYEGAAFISGDGKEKPRGFLNYDKVANSSYAWGKLGFIATGSTSGFINPSSSASPADCLIDLYYSLKKGYRNGAAFLTSDAVLGTIRKFKNADGDYLWAPPTVDMPGTVLGKPVETDDNMDQLGNGKFPVAFGNFKRGYTIADRMGTRVLRDPFTNKGNVLFYTTKRVGGGVNNFEAIKLLKCA